MSTNVLLFVAGLIVGLLVAPFLDLLCHLEAIHFGHQQVYDGQVGPPPLQGKQGLPSPLDRYDFVASVL